MPRLSKAEKERYHREILEMEQAKIKPYLDRIAELEKEVERITVAYNNCVRDNHYKTLDLEKENAELKEKLNKIERKCKFNFVDLLHDVENESKQEEQLTKAKEIIKQLMRAIPYGSGKLATESYDEAEQFLKENA